MAAILADPLARAGNSPPRSFPCYLELFDTLVALQTLVDQNKRHH